MNIFDESVNGTVIGDIAIVGRVYYDGRPQGPQIYSYDDEVTLREYAEDLIKQLKEDCGDAVYLIYPNESDWELRIFD